MDVMFKVQGFQVSIAIGVTSKAGRSFKSAKQKRRVNVVNVQNWKRHVVFQMVSIDAKNVAVGETRTNHSWCDGGNGVFTLLVHIYEVPGENAWSPKFSIIVIDLVEMIWSKFQ